MKPSFDEIHACMGSGGDGFLPFGQVWYIGAPKAFTAKKKERARSCKNCFCNRIYLGELGDRIDYRTRDADDGE